MPEQTPTNNFLGTADAQDLVIRTNNLERMRILSGGFVGVGVNNPPYRLTVADALNASVNESASVIATTYSVGFSDNDALHEDIYGVMGVADNTTYGSSAMDFGYGVVGLSETGFRGGIGVYGSPNNSLIRFNWDAGLAAAYDADRYVTIGLADRLVDGYYSYDLNGNTFGSFITLENNYNSSTIGKYGIYVNNISTYGIKHGIRIVNNNTATAKYGVYVALDNSAVTDNTNGIVFSGQNANSQGWGMLMASMGENPTYVAGGGGIFSMSGQYPVVGYATNADGTGIVGMGQNYGSILTLGGGSGVSGAGRDAGVYGNASNADGTGGVFVGNNAGASTLVNGSGVAGTGKNTGVYGRATRTRDCWGGYFYCWSRSLCLCWWLP